MDWPGRISLIGFSIGSVTWYNKRVHWLWGLCGIQLMTTRTSMMICNKFMPLLTIVYSRRFISCSNSPHTPGSHRGVSFSCVYHLYPISWQVSFVLLLVFFLWKVSYLWFSYVVCVDISMDRFFNFNYLLIIHQNVVMQREHVLTCENYLETNKGYQNTWSSHISFQFAGNHQVFYYLKNSMKWRLTSNP